MQRPAVDQWRRWLVGAAILYTLWLGFLYFAQEALIYPGAYFAHRSKIAAPPPGVESVWIEATPGIRVEGWFVRGHGRTAAAPGPAVILTHGNAEWIDDTTWYLAEYSRRGVSALSCEYRGYGRSGGSPTQAGITADVLALHDWLAARPEVRPDQIVFHGRSLGGGVVASLAAQRRPAALILESTFTSLASLTSRYLAPQALCKHPWRTDQVLPTLDRPILLIHGIHDSIIPVTHSRALHRRTPGSVLVELPGDHNDFPRDTAAYWEAIDAFLAAAGIGGG